LNIALSCQLYALQLGLLKLEPWALQWVVYLSKPVIIQMVPISDFLTVFLVWLHSLNAPHLRFNHVVCICSSLLFTAE
jgi:hypothetical protein